MSSYARGYGEGHRGAQRVHMHGMHGDEASRERIAQILRREEDGYDSGDDYETGVQGEYADARSSRPRAGARFGNALRRRPRVSHAPREFDGDRAGAVASRTLRARAPAKTEDIDSFDPLAADQQIEACEAQLEEARERLEQVKYYVNGYTEDNGNVVEGSKEVPEKRLPRLEAELEALEAVSSQDESAIRTKKIRIEGAKTIIAVENEKIANAKELVSSLEQRLDDLQKGEISFSGGRKPVRRASDLTANLAKAQAESRKLGATYMGAVGALKTKEGEAPTILSTFGKLGAFGAAAAATAGYVLNYMGSSVCEMMSYDPSMESASYNSMSYDPSLESFSYNSLHYLNFDYNPTGFVDNSTGVVANTLGYVHDNMCTEDGEVSSLMTYGACGLAVATAMLKIGSHILRKRTHSKEIQHAKENVESTKWEFDTARDSEQSLKFQKMQENQKAHYNSARAYSKVYAGDSEKVARVSGMFGIRMREIAEEKLQLVNSLTHRGARVAEIAEIADKLKALELKSQRIVRKHLEASKSIANDSDVFRGMSVDLKSMEDEAGMLRSVDNIELKQYIRDSKQRVLFTQDGKFIDEKTFSQFVAITLMKMNQLPIGAASVGAKDFWKRCSSQSEVYMKLGAFVHRSERNEDAVQVRAAGSQAALVQELLKGLSKAEIKMIAAMKYSDVRRVSAPSMRYNQLLQRLHRAINGKNARFDLTSKYAIRNALFYLKGMIDQEKAHLLTTALGRLPSDATARTIKTVEDKARVSDAYLYFFNRYKTGDLFVPSKVKARASKTTTATPPVVIATAGRTTTAAPLVVSATGSSAPAVTLVPPVKAAATTSKCRRVGSCLIFPITGTFSLIGKVASCLKGRCCPSKAPVLTGSQKRAQRRAQRAAATT